MKVKNKNYDPAKIEIAFLEEKDILTSSTDATNSDAPSTEDLGDWGTV